MTEEDQAEHAKRQQVANNTPTLLSDPLRAEIKELVREAVREAMNGNHGGDKLLTAEKAADILSVSPD